MTVIWNSKEHGTYVKAKHGAIGKVYLTNKQKRIAKRAEKNSAIVDVEVN